MAKIKLGALITDASGKLGGHVVGKNKGNFVLKTKSSNKNQPSLKQSEKRSTTNFLMKKWSLLSEDNLRTWYVLLGVFKSKSNVVGLFNSNAFLLFQKLNQGFMEIDLTPVDEAPDFDVPTPPVQLFVTSSGNQLIVNSDLYNSDEYIVIYATGGITKGTSNVSKKLRKIAIVRGDLLSGSVNITSDYASIFEEPYNGLRIKLAYKSYSRISGYSNGELVVSDSSFVFSGNSLLNANIRLIVGNSASLTSSDIAMRDFVAPLVSVVQIVSDDDYPSIINSDITLISESVNSGLVAGLKSANTPIITLEGGNFDEFSMGIAGSGSASFENVNLLNNHPIISGITFPFRYSNPLGISTQGSMTKSAFALSTAYLVSSVNSNTIAVIAFDSGDLLADGSNATNKRVYLAGANPQLFSTITNQIFENALNWCYGTL